MRPTYKTTIFACFVGYIVQAIVNNFAPLLFITFQKTYDIPLSQITLLVTINFCVQLTVDLLSTLFVDKIGYRTSIVIAQFFSASGLILLTVLPEGISPFAGMLAAVIVYAIGGGIIEVLISPIMESCPTDNKEKAMSLQSKSPVSIMGFRPWTLSLTPIRFRRSSVRYLRSLQGMILKYVQ